MQISVPKEWISNKLSLISGIKIWELTSNTDLRTSTESEALCFVKIVKHYLLLYDK